ncbi:RING finger protein 219 isoform X2 [Rhinatrema bivittatum]|uniref:RING finger protein 219 isoform X2 n=1 Tax=Rhinatrema bivittatum TaxID=194408 RepID=UPI00112B54A1|nr:RING finger protein 219 isoform X2 [Rhinatrema bivittatum]
MRAPPVSYPGAKGLEPREEVRQPVICVNYHVFCSTCIEVWLKNNNQCPACRIPITPDNPCKEIIGCGSKSPMAGGTGENDCIVSHPVRKHLRKTRLELLHKEYEDEIESLEKEIDELKGKNVSLESQLSLILDPVTLTLSTEKEERAETASPTESKVDLKTLEELNKKLQAANDMSMKLKEDVEKLKEANKKLRIENSAFVRENLRLKAEVDSRSPQKFGRFTVAALQSKLDQYERETNRLKKALERSDEYIEELESQVTQLKKETEGKNSVYSACEGSVLTENQESKGSGDVSTPKSPEENTEETILTASQSPEHPENLPSVDTMQDNSLMCSDSASLESSNESHCSMDKELFSDHQETLLSTTGIETSACLEKEWENKIDEYTPCKDKEYCEVPSLSTPVSLSSLHLNTPGSKNSRLDKKCVRKPSTYLRKLMFDDPPSEKTMDSNRIFTERSETSSSSGKKSVQPVFWNSDQTNYDHILDYECSEQSSMALQPGKSLSKSSDRAGPYVFKRLQTTSDLEGNRTRTSSEASMDAAYLDKISELDSMMSESENSKSPQSSRSADLDGASKLAQCTIFVNKSEEGLKDATKKTTAKYSHASSQPLVNEEWKPITVAALSPCSVDINEHFSFLIDQDSQNNEIKTPDSCFKDEKSSPVFFFCNSEKLLDPKSEPSFFNMSEEDSNLQNRLHSSWASSDILENGNRSNSHSTKRKILSSLSSDSPSKSCKN